MVTDAPLLDTTRAGIESLNEKFAPEHRDRFFLFHRDRQWNARERAWIGWERKRGKIEEFNRLLRGATGTSFSTQVGRLDLLPSVRYCLTLDSDTRLPRNAARTLVSVFAATIPTYPFTPGVHVNYESTVHPMKDGLPKMKDFPAEIGGSGETLPE